MKKISGVRRCCNRLAASPGDQMKGRGVVRAEGVEVDQIKGAAVALRTMWASSCTIVRPGWGVRPNARASSVTPGSSSTTVTAA